MSTETERVERGYRKLLEAGDPPTLDYVDLEILDIYEPLACLLGQRNGEYSKGLQALAEAELIDPLDDEQIHGLGFDVYEDLLPEIPTDQMEPYRLLTEAWKAKIEEARS